ncbi:hypothetical protein Ancab_038429 [Ancistrocladus abbreviatus]
MVPSLVANSPSTSFGTATSSPPKEPSSLISSPPYHLPNLKANPLPPRGGRPSPNTTYSPIPRSPLFFPFLSANKSCTRITPSEKLSPPSRLKPWLPVAKTPIQSAWSSQQPTWQLMVSV